MDRRTFLATPLVFLLDGGKDALDAAIARMKATGRPGVVLAVPEEERFRLGQRLWALTWLESDVEAQELFAQAVFTVLTPEAARARFKGVDATHVLLSPEGEVQVSDRAAWDVFASAELFGASFRPFLHGEAGERLAARGRALEAAFTPEEKAAAGKLDVDSLDERLAARATLAPRMERLAPWAGWVARSGTSERRRKQGRLLLSSYYAALPDVAKVPYGCRGPEYYSPCPTCGLARIDARQRMFLRILTGDPKKDAPPRRRGDD